MMDLDNQNLATHYEGGADALAESVDVAVNHEATLLHNFGAASLLVVAGVVISGFLLTSAPTKSNLDLPALPTAVWLSEGSLAGSGDSLNDLADRAFASGRVTGPVNDNALHYFHQAVSENAADERASEGLAKVVRYVIGSAEAAIQASDWAQAQRAAESILLLIPDHAGAQSVKARAETIEQLETLSRLAVNQLATDRLLSPRGDNALASYRRIARLDPGNAEAAVGIQTVAQRLVVKSQTAAVDGDFAASAEYMQQARNIAPDLGSLDQAAQLTDHFTRVTQLEIAEFAAAQAEASEQAALLADAENRIFNVSELTVVRRADPTFPRRAKGSQKEGWVELIFSISAEGMVLGAEVVSSSDMIFERPALGAIRKWRFKPYQKDGVAIPVRGDVRFSFRQ